MSFGNRASFASLKDAYGILEFSSTPEENYTIQNAQVSEEKQPIIEHFEEQTPHPKITCEMVKKHCSSCSCMNKGKYGPTGTLLNEFLNIGLICILIYILMYRPRV